MSVLETQALTKIFTKRHGLAREETITALDSVDVELNKREITGIVGASGSGKSTLAKILVMMYKPTSGQVIYEGEKIDARKASAVRKYRRNVQMVFQDPYASLDPNHNVEWHIKRPLLLVHYSGDVEQRIDELLEMVTLTPARYYRKKFPHQLSGGQRQRVYLARALAVEPKIVIADEPVSMLDVSVRIDILDLIGKLREDLGISFLYITHDLNTVSFLTDRVYVIERGKIVEKGETGNVLLNPSQNYTRQLIQAAPDPYKRIEDTGSVFRKGEFPSGPGSLNVDGVSAGYHTKDGFVKIIENLSFDVSQGEIFGIAGESGSGKSTAAQALFASLEYPGEVTGGSITVGGSDIMTLSENKLRSMRARKYSFVPQAAMNSLNPVRKIGDQFRDVLFAHGLNPDGSEDLIREKINLVRLDDYVLDLFPHELSGGMRQRAVIAMTLLLNPEIVIFDEPTTGLDVLVEYNILLDIKRIQKTLGLTVIFITHDLSILFEIADRVSIMYGGEIVESGPVSELLENSAHPYTYLLIKSIPRIGVDRSGISKIPGNTLDYGSEVSGCKFAERCPFRADECVSAHPGLMPAGDNGGHLQRCLKYPEWKEVI